VTVQRVVRPRDPLTVPFLACLLFIGLTLGLWSIHPTAYSSHHVVKKPSIMAIFDLKKNLVFVGV
jgi:hypothetical protein